VEACNPHERPQSVNPWDVHTRLNPDTVWGKVICPSVPRKEHVVWRDRLSAGVEAMWE